MAVTTSATAPTIAASDSTVGAVAWANPANIYGAGSATAALNNNQSQYLKASGFGFAIPTNAVILGITVSVTKSRSVGTGAITDTAVYLVRRGIIMSAAPNHRATANWPDVDAVSTYGGTDDLWGLPLLAEECNAWDFGFVISCTDAAAGADTASVNTITMTITYEPGYLASPQVQNAGEIFLFGQRYPLMPETNQSGRDIGPGKVRTTLATQHPQKVVTNRDFGRDSSQWHSVSSGDDLRGGMGHWRYIYDDQGRKLNGDCYWTSDGIDALRKGAITLPLIATSTGQPEQAGIPNNSDCFSLAELNAVLVGCFKTSQELHVFSAGAWTTTRIGVLSSLPTENATLFNNRLFYPRGSSGYSYHSGTTAGTLGLVEASTPTVYSFTVMDNRIWGIDATTGTLYSSTTGDSGSWETRTSIPGIDADANSLQISLVSSDNLVGDLSLWAMTNYGPFLWDRENDKWQRSRFRIPYLRSGRGNQIRMANTWGNAVMVKTGTRTLTRLVMGNNSLNVQPLTMGQDDVVVLQKLTTIDFVGTDDFLFVLFSADLADILQGNTGQCLLAVVVPHTLHDGSEGFAWHPLYFEDAVPPGDPVLLSRCQVGSTVGNEDRIYFTDSDETTQIVRYVSISNMRIHPLFGTGRTYAASGFVELPGDDFGFSEQVKTAQQFRIKILSVDPTAGDETVQVAYRINGSTGAYTNLGSAIAVNEEVHLPFGTNGVGLDFKSIQYRFTLARGSTTTDRPVIEYWATDSIRNVEVLRGYTVTLDLRNEYAGKSPQQMSDMVWAAMNANLFGTFAWRDDAGNTRSVLVKVVKPDGEEATGYDFGSTYSLLLVEMGWNG